MYRGPNDTTPSAHIRRTTAVVCVAAPSPITGGCGDNDVASDGTISRAAWDDRFDEICIAATDELSRSAPAMTEAEFAAFTTGAMTVVRALPLPDDGADTVRALLTRSPWCPGGSTDEEVDTIDQRIIETMTELGVSDECVGESRADAEPNPAPAATDLTSRVTSNTSTPTTKLKEDITMTTTTTATRIIRRVGAGSLIAGTVLAAGAATAHADHVHSVQVGNGTCVLLAHDGGESEVDLPFADEALVDANRAHPIHLLVHLGRAGENFAIGVYGTASDPCYETGNYVND